MALPLVRFGPQQRSAVEGEGLLWRDRHRGPPRGALDLHVIARRPLVRHVLHLRELVVGRPRGASQRECQKPTNLVRVQPLLEQQRLK